MKNKSNKNNNIGLSKEEIEWIDKHLSVPEKNTKEATIESVGVNGSVNGTYKRRTNSKLTISKRNAINKLKGCTYRTPPRVVAEILDVIFTDYESKEGHWLYITQNWNPRAINRVVVQMTKQHRRGDTTIKNPAAYFTYLIKFRKKRRNLTSSNDARKQPK